MQALRVLPLLTALVFATSGCQVMRRAKECQELSRILKEAGPELEQTPILANPSEKDLRRRARLYGQLGQSLQKVKLKEKQMSADANQLIKELLVLETELNRAAQVVAEYKLYLEEPKEEDAPPEAGPTSPASEGAEAQKKLAVVPGLIAPKGIPLSRTQKQKELGYVQGYNRARRAARTAGQNVMVSVDRIQKFCR